MPRPSCVPSSTVSVRSEGEIATASVHCCGVCPVQSLSRPMVCSTMSEKLGTVSLSVPVGAFDRLADVPGHGRLRLDALLAGAGVPGQHPVPVHEMLVPGAGDLEPLAAQAGTERLVP